MRRVIVIIVIDIVYRSTVTGNNLSPSLSFFSRSSSLHVSSLPSFSLRAAAGNKGIHVCHCVELWMQVRVAGELHHPSSRAIPERLRDKCT